MSETTTPVSANSNPVSQPAPSEPAAAAAVETAQKPPVVEAPKKAGDAVKTPSLDDEKKEAESSRHSVKPEARPHAFVVMPFGKKKGGDGALYDFNAIYKTLIKPALEEAGFEALKKKKKKNKKEK